MVLLKERNAMKSFGFNLRSIIAVLAATIMLSMSSGTFFYKFKNQKLPVESLITMPTTTVGDCLSLCSSNKLCNSVAYNKASSTSSCNMMRSTCGNVSLEPVQDREYDHYDTVNCGNCSSYAYPNRDMYYNKENCAVYSGGYDCLDYYRKGFRRNGVYTIRINSEDVKVYCVMDVDGGGWTVLQRREYGIMGFNLNWQRYELGFGSRYRDHWLGNKYVAALTVQSSELRVDLELFSGEQGFAKYATFRLDGNLYKLIVDGFSGTIGDSLLPSNDMFFSTHDSDNDASSGYCASDYKSGWWYNDCHSANLNAPYISNSTESRFGLIWHTWKSNFITMKKSRMMFRRNPSP